MPVLVAVVQNVKRQKIAEAPVSSTKIRARRTNKDNNKTVKRKKNANKKEQPQTTLSLKL